MAGKHRLVRTGLAVVSALVLLLSVTGWAASERYLSKVTVLAGLGGGAAWSGQPMNILLVGSDDRSGLTERRANRLHTGSQDFGRHSDTMMIVHLGGDLDTVTVVSLPRDSLVTIPAHTDINGKDVPEERGKINSAYASGGPELTIDTVQRATGLTMDHYVEVNFAGFLNMVDAVDGVEVCLPEPLADERSGLDLPAGRQTIRGKQALAYVRARYIDNDFGRAGRQQKFLSAMAQKVFSTGTLLNPMALNNVVDAGVSSLTTDEGLNRDSIAALAARAADVDLGTIVFTTVPVVDGDHMVDGESTVLWDADGASAMFAALAEDEPLPKPEKAVAVDVAPDDIKVAVVGSGPQADAVFGDLQRESYAVTRFPVPSAGPSPNTPPATTTVTYDPAWTNSVKTLRAALPGATFQQRSGQGEVFALTPGGDYAGLTRVRSRNDAPEATDRTARDDICAVP